MSTSLRSTAAVDVDRSEPGVFRFVASRSGLVLAELPLRSLVTAAMVASEIKRALDPETDEWDRAIALATLAGFGLRALPCPECGAPVALVDWPQARLRGGCGACLEVR